MSELATAPTPDLAEPTTGGDGNRWHLCRAPFTHAICGCKVDPASDRRPHSPGPACGHCKRIAELWLAHGIWEGLGPPPGPHETLELEVVIEK